MDKKVWYITGASRGLGLALIKKLLQEGHQVAASSGTLPALVEAVGKDHPDFLPLEVDLSNESSVAASISATHRHFGRIDIVVNNAGYGIGENTIFVIQKVLPYLHAQGSGHIINIVPMAGFAAAKQDTCSPGIHVTVVALGAFRTQFLSKEVRASHASYLSIDGKQPGDPVKAAAALLQIAASPEPPTLLFLGSDAYSTATAKMTELSQQIEQYKFIRSADCLQDWPSPPVSLASQW